MTTICMSYPTTQPYLTTNTPSPKRNDKMRTALTLATETTTVTASREVVETDTKDEVVVTVVVAATVVVVKETVDVVPADTGPTIILLTKTLGIICPGTNARPLLKHGNM